PGRDARITIDGKPAASGVASAPVAMPLGKKAVEVVVKSASGGARTYTISVANAPGYTYVKPGTKTQYGYFGYAFAFSGDTLAVGEIGDSSGAKGVGGDPNDRSARTSGAVYVFRRSGATWAQEAYIKPSNTRENFEFGASLALSGDTLAVGAPNESSGATGVNGKQDDSSVIRAGAVYVFT